MQASEDATAGLSEARTVMRHPSADLEGDAQRIAKSLGIPTSSARKSTEVFAVTLVVGTDWRTGTAYPRQSEAKAGDLPGNSDAVNGSDTSTCRDVYSVSRWQSKRTAGRRTEWTGRTYILTESKAGTTHVAQGPTGPIV